MFWNKTGALVIDETSPQGFLSLETIHQRRNERFCILETAISLLCGFGNRLNVGKPAYQPSDGFPNGMMMPECAGL